MKYLLIAAAAILPAWSAASAQDSNDYRVRVGAGARLQPQYVGADGVGLAPLFQISIARGTNEFSFGAPDDSASLALFSRNGLSFGPAGHIQGARKNSEVGAPVGKVPMTLEAGAFMQYQWGDSFRVRTQLLKGIDGHKGLIGTVSADKIWRDGDRYVFSVGPRVTYSDDRYQRAYFGVSSAASLATGLPTYRPRGGIQSVGIASGMSHELNRRWGLFGYARYERLLGDAARSPIVRDLGSRNQLSGGIGLNYTFIVRR